MSHVSDYPHTACFSVHSGVDPAALPRVMGQFAKRGLVPSQWHSTIAGPRGAELHIDLQVQGLRPELCEQIARTLRQMVEVRLVLTSEKRLAISA
ncbi:MAG: hypothetical protein HOH66_04545 [Rhodospirillaceae bacterium]|nr:hypothetical protein [Rhodospirillaceae bacterium]MBT6117115.1 hypothetical protein [Rhodospirillaceae bacterium]